MSLKINLSLTQKLTISHRMQQSLSILSLSCEELNQAIQKELLENPLLETVEKTDPSSFQKINSEITNFRMYDFLGADYKKVKKKLSFFSRRSF